MCPCIGHTFCSYHERVINKLYDRLEEAEASGDDTSWIRAQLAGWGELADLVYLKRAAAIR